MLTFAIVTPSRNHAAYLGDAVRSVRSQRGVEVDYLVRDGASTDDTPRLLAAWGVRHVSEPDGGQTDAINRGFAQTRGEILGWLNADDRLAPGALQAVAAFFADHPDVALVYGHARFIDAAGRPVAPCAQVREFCFDRLLRVGNYIVQPAAFFRRQAFEAVGGLDASLHWAMDYDLWLKLGRRFRVHHLSRVLADYRWLGDNKTAADPGARLLEVERLVRRHGADRLPAYFALESAAGAAAQEDYVSALRQLADLRALGAVLSPRTWRMIHTRLKLRRQEGDAATR